VTGGGTPYEQDQPARSNAPTSSSDRAGALAASLWWPQARAARRARQGDVRRHAQGHQQRLGQPAASTWPHYRSLQAPARL